MRASRPFHLVLFALLVACGPGCAKSGGEAVEGAPAGEPGAEPFGRLTLDELEGRMTEAKTGKLALQIFDVNPRARFDQSHIPSAKWLSFHAFKAADLPADKDATLVFYCASEL